jgi:type II secretory pathway predicted ATPase ExeA
MIKSFFGTAKTPFDLRTISLLPFQQTIFDILKVHSQQGGLCLVLGEPGTGKSVIKDALKEQAEKQMKIVSIGRTLHTYTNTIKILCQAFNIEFQGDSFKCEKRLIEEAFSLNRIGKMLVTIIDDAHLLEIDTLRRLRLLFEDFPKNHNIILVGQPELLYAMSLKINEDIKSRVTYSVILSKLTNDDIQDFILAQLDTAGLGHNIFTDDALPLIARSADGILRKVRNLCLSCLLEAVRKSTKSIGIDIVNAVLIQPHWRLHSDFKVKEI